MIKIIFTAEQDMDGVIMVMVYFILKMGGKTGIN
jgi:hypothetical protein